MSIEHASGPRATEAIETSVRRNVSHVPMQMTLNASSKVSFYGDRFVHSYCSHQFDGKTYKIYSISFNNIWSLIKINITIYFYHRISHVFITITIRSLNLVHLLFNSSYYTILTRIDERESLSQFSISITLIL
jgi:hypothetical protein